MTEKRGGWTSIFIDVSLIKLISDKVLIFVFELGPLLGYGTPIFASIYNHVESMSAVKLPWSTETIRQSKTEKS